MKREFVSYKQAVVLRELGFSEQSFLEYDKEGRINNKWGIGNIPAPLKQQVFRWFREEYDLLPNIWSGKINHIFYGYDILHIKKQRFVVNNTELGGGDCDYDTYEEAEDACIDTLIELAKQQ